jgi:L-lactate dehydrogenase complex protein LldG
MDLLEKFCKLSESVGSTNILTPADSLEEVLKPFSSETRYVLADRFGLTNNDIEVKEEGVDFALVQADHLIAETGSVVLDSTSEKIRLATCLAEHLVIIIEKSRLVAELADVADFMTERNRDVNAYIAFITGASRTADIERVLTVGVHGPKEMTVVIVEDK